MQCLPYGRCGGFLESRQCRQCRELFHSAKRLLCLERLGCPHSVGLLNVRAVYIASLSRVSEQRSVPRVCRVLKVSRVSAKCLKCLGRRGCQTNVKGVPRVLCVCTSDSLQGQRAHSLQSLKWWHCLLCLQRLSLSTWLPPYNGPSGRNGNRQPDVPTTFFKNPGRTTDQTPMWPPQGLQSVCVVERVQRAQSVSDVSIGQRV